LLGEEDDAETALADRLHHLVPAEDRPWHFRGAPIGLRGLSLKEMPGLPVSVQEGIDACPQRRVAAAGTVEVHRLFGWRGAFKGFPENGQDLGTHVAHGQTLPVALFYSAPLREEVRQTGPAFSSPLRLPVVSLAQGLVQPGARVGPGPVGRAPGQAE